jgi:hypothetical protein
MNERIKEMMQQAGTDTSGKWMGVEHAEKFAQLIVQECARVAFESDLTMAIGQWGADSAILKHFGVEE